ncbi:hypothetical protein [Micromonospora cremea]|uniref:hypothetical protein n=1 Tax=Micromonospora cremea TaxID=709881 RepID=UPI001FCADA94|nr:hypothetical protein [Micromonospora cremea]
MERWLQTCRRELLDRTLIWNQRHLLHALKEFEDFYNSHRPSPRHRQRTPVTPDARAARRPERLARLAIRRHDRLGGVLPRMQACCVTCTDEISASAGWWSQGIEGGLAHIFVYNIRSQSRRLEELPSNPCPSETSPRRLRPLRIVVVTVALALHRRSLLSGVGQRGRQHIRREPGGPTAGPPTTRPTHCSTEARAVVDFDARKALPAGHRGDSRTPQHDPPLPPERLRGGHLGHDRLRVPRQLAAPPENRPPHRLVGGPDTSCPCPAHRRSP